MERYDEKELQGKKISQLKQILKNKQLKISGNKDDLIKRILDNQPTTIRPTQKDIDSYFNLLPTDINKMINKYRIENESNNQVAKALLNYVADNFNWDKDLIIYTNEILENANVPFKMIENKEKEELIAKFSEEDKYPDLEFEEIPDEGYKNIYYNYAKLPDVIILSIREEIIIDEVIAELFLILLNRGLNYKHINQELQKYNSPLTIIKLKSKKGQNLYRINTTNS